MVDDIEFKMTTEGDVAHQRLMDDREKLVTIDVFQVRYCGNCERKGKVRDFRISRFPVMFFWISDLGMETVSGSCSRTCCSPCLKSSTTINLNSLLKRLVEVFIFGVCLLTIVRAPTAMSAPASCRERDLAEENVPKWKNPCGQEQVLENYSTGASSEESDRDIVGQILTAARIALDHMYDFRENYVNETFQISYDKHLSIFRHEMHLWLPVLPKKIGEKVGVDHMKKQKLEEFLQLTYESLQKYAVGIEQVVLDQQSMEGNFQEQFTETEWNLRKVLCQLRTAMFNKNITPSDKVERCIMDSETRKAKETAHRNLRDWIIFRECQNGLEYLIQNLEYFEAKSPS